MSSEPVIVASGLSKCYQIYEQPLDRLKQSILPRIQRLAGRPSALYFKEFWALRDVSFAIERGESLGIVGRNGSGKSTLLQIICGTLTPTLGTVETRGRIAALLELGSGFNPEFTGRDNVYLNASLLGMRRDEIDRRFDDIAAFADIGAHLDQPVKTYSSGMFVRLAFAVVAHVDADILVVDEALSVGDAVFTQKCMRFIRRFQESGTLIFVSHDTPSIQNLCRTALWLDKGRLQRIGGARSVSEAYLRATLQDVYGTEVELGALDDAAAPAASIEEAGSGPATAAALSEPTIATASHDVAAVVDYEARATVASNMASARGFQTGEAQIVSVEFERQDGKPADVLLGGEAVRVRVKARTSIDLDQPILGFLVRDRLGQDLFGENTLPLRDVEQTLIPAGESFEAEFEFRLPMLPNGHYSVMASVANGTLYDNIQHHYLHDAVILTVASSRIRYGLVGIEFGRIALNRLPPL